MVRLARKDRRHPYPPSHRFLPLVRLGLMVQSALSVPVLCWQLQPLQCLLSHQFRLLGLTDRMAHSDP